MQFVDQFYRQSEKLLTKLSGFLISCAMPAVSWPSEASFSVWTRLVLRRLQIAQRRLGRVSRCCESPPRPAFSL